MLMAWVLLVGMQRRWVSPQGGAKLAILREAPEEGVQRHRGGVRTIAAGPAHCEAQ